MLVKFLVCVLAGLGAGIGTGLAGLSAAAVISPMLVTFLGFPSYQAVAISLASDVLASAVSAYTYGRHKNLDIKNGSLMLGVVLVLTLVGSLVAFQMPNDTMSTFSVLMTLVLGLRFIICPVTATHSLFPNSGRAIRITESVVCGIVIGFICGFIGAGGGMMMLLVFTSVLGYELKTAVGTSVFIMTFTALTGADIPANNRLFDTLDTTTRTLEISDTCTVLISDTVGFISKLPHHLVEAFKATLEELSFADLLLHVIDASNPEWREQAEVVEKLIAELGAEQTPRIDVFNKCDKCPAEILPHGADIVSISAKTGQGLDELLGKIGGHLDTGACRVELSIPYDKGGLVDLLHREAKVEQVDYGETIQVTAVCTPVQLGRLKDYVVSGWTPPKEFWED